MQRSGGRSESSVLQEWGGGACGWRGVCEGEGRKGGGVLQGLERHGEDLGFYPEGGGSPGELWTEKILLLLLKDSRSSLPHPCLGIPDRHQDRTPACPPGPLSPSDSPPLVTDLYLFETSAKTPLQPG